MQIVKPTFHGRRCYPRGVDGAEGVLGLVAGRVETGIVPARALRSYGSRCTRCQATCRGEFACRAGSTFYARNGVFGHTSVTLLSEQRLDTRGGSHIRASNPTESRELRTRKGTGFPAHLPTRARTGAMNHAHRVTIPIHRDGIKAQQIREDIRKTGMP